MTTALRPCGHCRRPRRIKARGLCQPCYIRPEVRAKHPVRFDTAPKRTPRDRGPTDAELDATMAAVLARGKPAGWDGWGGDGRGCAARSVIFERFAAGDLFPWRSPSTPGA